MTTTAHAMTGAAIAAVIKKPKWAIPLAFLSHFVCDALPHLGLGFKFGSITMYVYLFAEALALTGCALFLYRRRVKNLKLMAICAFAAMSPDFAWLFYGLRGQQGDVAAMDPLSHFHYVIQWGESKVGVVFDVIWITIMMKIILKVNNKGSKSTTTLNNPVPTS